MKYDARGRIVYFGDTMLGTTLLEIRRKELKLSREKLARKADCSASTIQRLETEGAPESLTLKIALSLSVALDTTILELWPELIPAVAMTQFRYRRLPRRKPPGMEEDNDG